VEAEIWCWNSRSNSAFAPEMSEESYARYFADREIFERAMSRRATDQRVAEVHAEMAERYEALATVFGAKPAAGPRIS
jgi:glutathione S-transferase